MGKNKAKKAKLQQTQDPVNETPPTNQTTVNGQQAGHNGDDAHGEANDLVDTKADVSGGAEANGASVGEGNSTNAAAGEGNDNKKGGAKDNSPEKGNDDKVPNQTDAGAAEVSGLKELIGIIEVMGATGLGEHSAVSLELVNKLKETMLYPVYEALQVSWQKMLVRMSEAGRIPLPPSPPLTPRVLSDKPTQDPLQESPHTSPRVSVDVQTEPLSPPLTPRELLDKPTRDSQPQPQQSSQPPSKVSVDVQTDPILPPLAPRKLPDPLTRDPQDQPQKPSHPPPKVSTGQQTDPQDQPQKPSHSPPKVSTGQQTDPQHQPQKPSPPLKLSTGQQTDPRPRPKKPSPPLKLSTGQQTDPIPPPLASLRTTQPKPAVPSWDPKELKSLEAGITSLSSKIDSMSQEMSKMAGKEDITKNLGTWDNKLTQVGSQTIEQVKSSAGTTKTHIDKVDSTVAKLSNKLDASVATMQQSIKQLNDTIAKRPANVTQAPAPTPTPTPTSTTTPRIEPKPDSKAGELEAQVKRLHQDLDSTRTELLQADIAFKAALEGIFTAEAEAATIGTEAASRRDTLEIARGIRASTLRLITRCRLLFSLIASNSSPSGTNLAILEGEWTKCVEHLKTRDFRERKAIKEKDEAKQELQFFRFLVDQIQRGFYSPSEWKLALNGQDRATFMEKPFDGFASIKRLAEEMYRLQHTRSRPMKASPSSKPKHEESRNAPPPGWGPLSSSP